MAHSIHGAFKPNRNDLLCTPKILVECLKPYFCRWMVENGKWVDNTTVWCPADKENSEYVIFFKELGCKVIYSHIDYGQDFLTYTPEEPFDIVCTNPPFSLKEAFFRRCNELGKPWILLSNVMSLNYMCIGNYFADNPVQMLIPDKRISFDGNPSSFCSGYFCKDFLIDRDLEFCHLPHCNSGKDFVPSRMIGE